VYGQKQEIAWPAWEVKAHGFEALGGKDVKVGPTTVSLLLATCSYVAGSSVCWFDVSTTHYQQLGKVRKWVKWYRIFFHGKWIVYTPIQSFMYS
jgi:hypothetical protein